MATPRAKKTTSPTVKPVNEVDDTVKNQESLGSVPSVNRNPDPQIVEDSEGIKYDVNKSQPELVTEDPEDDKRKAHLKQTEGAMNASDLVDSEEEKKDRKYIELELLESGFTVLGKVWKAGEVIKFEDDETVRENQKDTEGTVWYDLSSSEQEKRYGKVFFEKR